MKLLTALAVLVFYVVPAFAASGPHVTIRDAETENAIREWTKGVFSAAGMTPDQIRIILVQDPGVNAFVAGGSNIFIYTGLIQKTDNPGEVVGVIAHETGHIVGGHLSRTSEAAEHASFEAIAGAILGVGAALATGDSSAAAAGVRIGQGLAMNDFLAYSRVQESSADQAGLRLMQTAGLSPEGLVTFLGKLSSEELLPAQSQSEFARTHPMSRDRIEALNSKLEQSPLRSKKYPQDWDDQHARIKAKLLGFISPQQVMYLYPSSDTSLPARYAQAISAYRINHVEEALKLADGLIAIEPNNPYFYELKGQMLFDFGRAAEAIPPYEKSVKFLPSSGLIRLALAQALIESARGNKTRLQEAINHLKRAERDEPRMARIKRLLATAYGLLGEENKARVYLAEETLMQGRRDEATKMAKAALGNLAPKTPEYLRAQDIINSVDRPEEDR
jgi:predicted Zn-dependent protease